MNHIGQFWSVSWTIYIPLIALASAFTHIGVSFWRFIYSSYLSAVTITVRIWYSSIFIRRFYNTFINIFNNFRAFNHIYRSKVIVFQSKPCTYAWLLRQSGILFKNNLPNYISLILSLCFDIVKSDHYLIISIILSV